MMNTQIIKETQTTQRTRQMNTQSELFKTMTITSKLMFKQAIAVTILLTPFFSAIIPVNAAPVNPSALPHYVPNGSRQASRHITVQPDGWNSLTPWGEAINTANSEGYVEMRSWEMVCQVNGNRTTIVSDLRNVGVSLYLTERWYWNDQNTPISIEKTQEGLRMAVKNGGVTHWWLNTPRPRFQNVEDCEVTAEIRMSPGVFVGIGGDFWVDTTSGWNGQDVNNKYMGRSDWHDHNGGWQTIRF